MKLLIVAFECATGRLSSTNWPSSMFLHGQRGICIYRYKPAGQEEESVGGVIECKKLSYMTW